MNKRTLAPEHFQRIVLTGYMGAGKSTIGRYVAQAMRYVAVDTDLMLKRQFRQSITDIFAQHGEAVFRQAELDLMTQLVTRVAIVISVGGGTLTRDDTVALTYPRCAIVYLKADVNILHERVLFSHKDRPMLDVPDSKAVFAERFKAREPYYEQADCIVPTGDRPKQAVVDDILAWLNQQGVLPTC